MRCADIRVQVGMAVQGISHGLLRQIVKRDPKQTPARFSLLPLEITLSSLCDFPLSYLPAMPLSGSAKVAYQRKYMRKVRQTQAGDSLSKRESIMASRR